MFTATTTVRVRGRRREIMLRLRHSSSSGVSGQWWFTGVVDGKPRVEPGAMFQWHVGFLRQTDIDCQDDIPQLVDAILDALEKKDFMAVLPAGGPNVKISVKGIGFADLHGSWWSSEGLRYKWRYDFRRRKLLAPKAKEVPGLKERLDEMVKEFIGAGE